MDSLTNDEKNLDGNVSDSGATCQVLITNKTNVIRHRHSNIECSQKDQPIPACLEGAEVEKNELGLLGISNFIFRKSWWITKNILEREHNSSEVTGSVLTLFLYLSLSLVFEWSHLVKFDFTLFLTVMQVS